MSMVSQHAGRAADHSVSIPYEVHSNILCFDGSSMKLTWSLRFLVNAFQ